MLNIVLFGAPGCGKGTQAAKLVEKYNLNHISTGAVIRSEINAQTELGKSMEAYISRGELAISSTASPALPRRLRLSIRSSRHAT